MRFEDGYAKTPKTPKTPVASRTSSTTSAVVRLNGEAPKPPVAKVQVTNPVKDFDPIHWLATRIVGAVILIAVLAIVIGALRGI
jgi:hypothetical protein